MTTPAGSPGPTAAAPPSDGTRRSLLIRARSGDPAAWAAFTTLYRPLILGWLRRQGVPAGELDDLVQEILLSVVQSLPRFDHPGRAGAFRAWLRAITSNCVREHLRKGRQTPRATGDTDFQEVLGQLEDSSSELAREWDREHNLHLTQALLDILKTEFEPRTWQAFDLFALQGRPAAEVAAELGLTPNAVFIAKSRILTRLREEAAGLLD